MILSKEATSLALVVNELIQNAFGVMAIIAGKRVENYQLLSLKQMDLSPLLFAMMVREFLLILILTEEAILVSQ